MWRITTALAVSFYGVLKDIDLKDFKKVVQVQHIKFFEFAMNADYHKNTFQAKKLDYSEALTIEVNGANS